MSERSRQDQPLLYYVHIPKTAGTSLSHIFYQQYGERLGSVDGAYLENWQSYMALNPNGYDCLFGHFMYGFHESVRRPFEYTTVVRHSVDALLSYHAYIVRRPDHPFHALLADGTLKSFFRLPPEFLCFFRNYQTAMITGHVPSLAVDAYSIISENYPIVGTTERLHETVFLWQKRYGWGVVAIPRENVSPGRLSREQLDSGTLRRLEALADQDLLIYRFANERLDAAINSLTNGERRTLAEFKQTGVLQGWV